jgi:hypothetical protein
MHAHSGFVPEAASEQIGEFPTASLDGLQADRQRIVDGNAESEARRVFVLLCLEAAGIEIAIRSGAELPQGAAK